MYKIINNNSGFSVTCSATFENIDMVCADLKEFFEKHGVESEFFGVSLGVREALTNAVRHGCTKNSELEVSFSVLLNGSELLICVADPGCGFDWCSQGKKCALDSDTSGRGLIILKEYFDSYVFNNRGNKVELRKNLIKEGT